MNQLIPFSFEGAAVRVIDRDGEPWFVLADVCAVLGITNPWNAAARLDEDERGLHTVETPGGVQEMNVVNESGLWSLVLTSRKESAKRFKKWITAEVIPTIRKTGGYGASALPDLSNPVVLQQLLADHVSKRIEAEHALAIAAPKADAFERIAGATGNVSLTLAAKDLKVPPRRFIKWCDANRWTYRRGKQRLPFQDKVNSGYLVMRADTVPVSGGSDLAVHQTLVTPKGLTKLAMIFNAQPIGAN